MKANNRLGSQSVDTLRLLLTNRDLAILRSIRQYKFLATRQICELVFTDHASDASAIRACNRVLSRLLQHRLIYRLARPVGGDGGGSRPFVWGIDAAGDRLLRADPDGVNAKRFRSYEPTSMFLHHTLAIADVAIDLERLARGKKLELVELVTEPSNWRPFSHGGRAQILKPDLYVVTANEQTEWHRFVEVDRGTESITALLNKCLIYQNYESTGHEENLLGIFPEVLWLVPTASRARGFAQALKADRRLDDRLHRIITFADFESEMIPTTNDGPMPEEGGL
jgi:hypothetical protein